MKENNIPIDPLLSDLLKECFSILSFPHWKTPMGSSMQAE